jgi:peptidylprolyl isomerase
MQMLQRAAKGNTVQVHYTGRFKDGRIFDSSRVDQSQAGEALTPESGGVGEPMEFVVGSGSVIPGFDNAVMGMLIGDRKTVEIRPEDAYGELVQEFVKVVPRSQLNLEFDVQQGMILELRSEGGRAIPITVAEVSDSTVTLDANHPLAGKILVFDIELMSISPEGE